MKSDIQYAMMCHDILTKRVSWKTINKHEIQDLVGYLTENDDHYSALRIVTLITQDEVLETLAKIIHKRYNNGQYEIVGNGELRNAILTCIREHYIQIWKDYIDYLI